MDQPSFYAIIPANVRYDNRLKANAKLLYGEITALCSKEGYCWSDNEYFAQLYSVDSKTVSRWISQLQDFGYIVVQLMKAEGNKRKIYLDHPTPALVTKRSLGSDKKVTTLVTKKSLPSDKKVTSINRNSITISNTVIREENALDFLAINYPSRMETFMMQNKAKLPDWDAFVADFNCKVIEEQKVWEQDVLFARLQRLAQNWIRNNNKAMAMPVVGAEVSSAYMNKRAT